MKDLANLILFQQEVRNELTGEVQGAVLFSDLQLGHAQERLCDAPGTLIEDFSGLQALHIKRGNPTAGKLPLGI
jgi:hypothetical protein